MRSMISRNKAARMFVVSEQDEEGEFFVDSVAHELPFAERRAEVLRNRAENGSVKDVFVTELRWEYGQQIFVSVTAYGE